MSAPGQRGTEIFWALSAGVFGFLATFIAAEAVRFRWWAAELDKEHSGVVAAIAAMLVAAAVGHGVGRWYAGASPRSRVAWRVGGWILFLGTQYVFWASFLH